MHHFGLGEKKKKKVVKTYLADVPDERVGQSWITRPVGDEQAVVL